MKARGWASQTYTVPADHSSLRGGHSDGDGGSDHDHVDSPAEVHQWGTGRTTAHSLEIVRRRDDARRFRRLVGVESNRSKMLTPYPNDVILDGRFDALGSAERTPSNFDKRVVEYNGEELTVKLTRVTCSVCRCEKTLMVPNYLLEGERGTSSLGVAPSIIPGVPGREWLVNYDDVWRVVTTEAWNGIPVRKITHRFCLGCLYNSFPVLQSVRGLRKVCAAADHGHVCGGQRKVESLNVRRLTGHTKVSSKEFLKLVPSADQFEPEQPDLLLCSSGRFVSWVGDKRLVAIFDIRSGALVTAYVDNGKTTPPAGRCRCCGLPNDFPSMRLYANSDRISGVHVFCMLEKTTYYVDRLVDVIGVTEGVVHGGEPERIYVVHAEADIRGRGILPVDAVYERHTYTACPAHRRVMTRDGPSEHHFSALCHIMDVHGLREKHHPFIVPMFYGVDAAMTWESGTARPIAAYQIDGAVKVTQKMRSSTLASEMLCGVAIQLPICLWHGTSLGMKMKPLQKFLRGRRKLRDAWERVIINFCSMYSVRAVGMPFTICGEYVTLPVCPDDYVPATVKELLALKTRRERHFALRLSSLHNHSQVCERCSSEDHEVYHGFASCPQSALPGYWIPGDETVRSAYGAMAPLALHAALDAGRLDFEPVAYPTAGMITFTNYLFEHRSFPPDIHLPCFEDDSRVIPEEMS